jgi:hypothetical protein
MATACQNKEGIISSVSITDRQRSIVQNLKITSLLGEPKKKAPAPYKQGSLIWDSSIKSFQGRVLRSSDKRKDR